MLLEQDAFYCFVRSPLLLVGLKVAEEKGREVSSVASCEVYGIGMGIRIS